VLQCVAVCCSECVDCGKKKSVGRESERNQRVAACCNVLQCAEVYCNVLQCIAVCCSVLQYAAACCSMLQCVAQCCSVLHNAAVCCTMLQCVAQCCSVLHNAAVCCTMLQCAYTMWKATERLSRVGKGLHLQNMETQIRGPEQDEGENK